MSVTVRNADLEHDADEILQCLQNNLAATITQARFDWLYMRNPFGAARVWMAMDEASHTVGVAAAFPRSIWIDCKPRTAWVLGDFCVAPGRRSLGPALLLQRACLKSLANEGS